MGVLTKNLAAPMLTFCLDLGKAVEAFTVGIVASASRAIAAMNDVVVAILEIDAVAAFPAVTLGLVPATFVMVVVAGEDLSRRFVLFLEFGEFIVFLNTGTSSAAGQRILLGSFLFTDVANPERRHGSIRD